MKQFDLFQGQVVPRIERAKKLYKKAQDKRREVESELIRAFEVTMPSRPFRQDVTHVYSPDRTEIYSSTAPKSVRNLTTQTIGLMIPHSQPWAEIEILDERAKKRSEWRKKVEAANKKLENFFRDGSFYLATANALPNGIISGVYAIQIIDERLPTGNKPIEFKPVPVDELTFDTTYADKVDCVFRTRSMRARQILTRFRDLPDDLLEELSENETKSFKVIEGVVPNGDRFDYDCWIERGRPLARSKIKWNPFIVARWAGIDANPWGNSPIREALPEINTANQIAAGILRFGEFAAYGVWQTTDVAYNPMNTDQIEPGAVIPVQDPLTPLEFPGQFPLSFEMADRSEQKIQQLLLDQPMPTTEQLKNMKAEAVVFLRQQFYAQIGEPAIRLSYEYLTPVAQQVFERMLDRGDLELLSRGEIENLKAQIGTDMRDGDFLKSLFRMNVNAAVSRVRSAQQAMQTIEAVGRAVRVVGPQEVATIVDMRKLAREIMIGMGLAADVLRSEAESDAIRAQQEKATGQNLSVESLLTAVTGGRQKPANDLQPPPERQAV